MLSPQFKIILTLIYIILLFLIKSPLVYVVFFVGLAITCFIVRMPITDILNLLKKILPIITFTAIINMFFIDGEIIWSLGFVKISVEGIKYGVLMVIRIIFLILGSSILTHTTTPLLLTHGIEVIMKPLGTVGFPVKEFAMIMMISLRFIPILEEETNKIKMAQKSRGVNLDTSNIFKKVKLLNAIVIPLLISIFRRSEQIAIAMEARSYTN